MVTVCKNQKTPAIVTMSITQDVTLLRPRGQERIYKTSKPSINLYEPSEGLVIAENVKLNKIN